MPVVVNKTEEILADMCEILFSVAQRHVSNNDHKTIAELAHVAKILNKYGVPTTFNKKLAAQRAAYSTEAVIKNTQEYRMLRAKFTACLSTIADLGQREVRQAKSQFHAGINEGLRRAAKIAIMFLEDFNDNGLEAMADVRAASAALCKSTNDFVRK
jgi:hypothetical protein